MSSMTYARNEGSNDGRNPPRHVTIEGCKSKFPISPISGGYRYAFNVNGQRCLVRSCESHDARHAFVSNGPTEGPNVLPAGSNPRHDLCQSTIPEAVTASVRASACPAHSREPFSRIDSMGAYKLLSEPSLTDGHPCTFDPTGVHALTVLRR